MTETFRSLGKDIRGIVSVCTAHPLAIEAGLVEARKANQDVLIEATCNQVNHLGGYTGMTPADFIARTREIARGVDFPLERLHFGGDHLGPNPWCDQPAEQAMAQAREMMAAYVEAGFRKIHLDCSMGCAGEPEALDDATTAARAAELCAVAESIAPESVYIIGTEIPPPGGAHHELDGIRPTEPEAVLETFAVHKRVFAEKGLEEAFQRVIGIVVQPGVESAQMSVVQYDPAKTRDLVAALPQMPGLVFEAHSTDYQSGQNLKDLVDDKFAILKVGPCMTFAVRQAYYGIEMACRETDGGDLALRDTLERLMLADPGPWTGHVHGEGALRMNQLHFGLSDRIRYYWPQPEAQAALDDLRTRFRRTSPPIGVLSQYLGADLIADALAADDDLSDLDALARRAAGRMVRPWFEACA